ncbi:flagellar protein FliS [Selenomonas infelix ATCC 43532]|uniref:Flagellar secretion chaperone FliS n=1 Tax=Selenomonas infelix ATCC 43532 TaxID=679201 RepID=G5GQW5_9FIRM|nr:flagellar export chaperone FliS [Selenomonas infelix]EHG20330.1 flagellar protein FliS [Selenomonas infelix ATCC 43532]
MVNSAAEAYKKQQVMTATPEALTLMLYNGCLKFIKEGVEQLAEKNYEASNTSFQKAQNIISEFRITLNMDYEISHQLLPLYNYAYDRLVEGNMKSDPALIQEATDIMTELRDAWAQAMKKAREEKGVQGMEGSGVYAG